MVNQWAQDLAVLTVDGVEYVAVGVSGPDVLAGCYIRRQDGGFWQRVGIGNVGDVVGSWPFPAPTHSSASPLKKATTTNWSAGYAPTSLLTAPAESTSAKTGRTCPQLSTTAMSTFCRWLRFGLVTPCMFSQALRRDCTIGNAVSDVWAAINWNTEEVLSIAIMPAQAAGQPPLLVVGGKFSENGQR